MFASPNGRSGTEKPRLGKILPPPKPEQCVSLQRWAVSHTRLAAYPRGPRLAIGRGRRELRLRSGLDSRQRWQSRKGPQLETRLPDTQH